MNVKASLTLAVAALSLAVAPYGLAQSEADGPTALIATYRALPGERVKFREIMRTEGCTQFEKWRQSGVFAGFQVLFTTYAASSQPDMFVILSFEHVSDMARWQRIEESFPGGLPPDAQPIASADTSYTADIVRQSSTGPSTRESQLLVLEYDVLVDMPRYTSYLLGYAVPQFDAWEKTGDLRSYAAYVNQNPAGAPWSGFILLEYRDLKALAAREVIQNQASAELAASDPAWKGWSDNRTAISRESAAIPVRALP
ncbi:MAG: hypothetical protein ABR910_04150 [Acidobacteriaceae bacterium]|jgi:hypothetical protein